MKLPAVVDDSLGAQAIPRGISELVRSSSAVISREIQHKESANREAAIATIGGACGPFVARNLALV